MKMNIIILLISWVMISCSKNNTVADQTPLIPPPTETPAQYGTPFTQVPEPKDAIIYQVNTRAFSISGRFQGIIERLDSIKALGVNVICLMPVYPVGTVNSVNSPYCIKDFGQVASEFGNLADLRALVDGAHARNIAVIFDWISDHTSWDHPWITANKSWYKQDANGNVISPPNTGWNDVAALNYNNQDLRKAMIKAMKYWVYTANIDGYRCDAADFVPFDFWKQAIDSLRGISTHKLLMFAEGTRNDHFNAGFQMEYGMGFFYKLKDKVFAQNVSVKAIDTINNIEYTNANIASQVVRYTSNHDVNLTDGTPADLFGGLQGSLATFLVAAYMKGVPMIYNGQEIGYPVRLNYFNNSTPISWTPNPAISENYKQIIAFRKNSEAIKKGTLTSFSNDDVCVFEKIAGAEEVLVLANLRGHASTYTVPAALMNTTWINAFSGQSFTVGSQVNMDPYQYLVLKN